MLLLEGSDQALHDSRRGRILGETDRQRCGLSRIFHVCADGDALPIRSEVTLLNQQPASARDQLVRSGIDILQRTTGVWPVEPGDELVLDIGKQHAERAE